MRISDKLLNSKEDGNKLLKEYGFVPNDRVMFCERNHGGSSLQSLEGEVWLTKEPCCVSYEDNPNEWRAKLACGHVVGKCMVGPKSLTSTLNIEIHLVLMDCCSMDCCLTGSLLLQIN